MESKITMKKFFTFITLSLFWVTSGFAQGVSDQDVSIRPAQLKAYLSGKTIRTYNRSVIGNMITYFAPNGKMYIWPPRRDVLTTGTWKACSQEATMVDAQTNKVKKIKLAAICRTVKGNGKTTKLDISWIEFKEMIRETEKGDAFSLANKSQRAPYVMGKRSVDFAYLRRKIK
jgi:hypothetical protein